MENLTQIGAAGSLAVLILVIVFQFLNKRGSGSALVDISKNLSDLRTCMDEIKEMVKQIREENHDLHVWHDVPDQEGGKIWYVRQGLKEAMDRLGIAIETQTEVLRSLAEEFRELRRAVKKNG